MLAIAITLSGYASVDRHLPAGLSLRLGTVNAEGLVIGQGGDVGSVHLGRLSTIIKPVSVPTSAPVSHSPLVYTVGDGEDLNAVAAKFHITVESIRWSNFDNLSSAAVNVSRGASLLIPPVKGVAITSKEGDTPAALAAAYHSSSRAIIDFNYVRSGEDVALVPGTQIVIPDGQGPEISPASVAAPVRIAAASAAPRTTSPGFTVSSAPASAPVSAAPSGGNRFSYGYCTWYVYNRRPVPWLGNAWEWFGGAQRAGWATGSAPRPGAIMVTWESSFGHVAYVESVAGDGSWTVSEMNFRGWGVVSTRSIRPGGVPLIGFIY